jgi:hypothetical protein
MTQLLEGKNAIICGALTGTIVNATCGIVPG